MNPIVGSNVNAPPIDLADGNSAEEWQPDSIVCNACRAAYVRGATKEPTTTALLKAPA